MPTRKRDLSGTARCLDCGARAEHERGPGTPLVIRHDESCLEGIPGEIDRAKALLQRDADEGLWSMLSVLEETGLGEWILDPNEVGVVGLVQPGTLTAFVIVYLKHRDWEADEELIASRLSPPCQTHSRARGQR